MTFALQSIDTCNKINEQGVDKSEIETIVSCHKVVALESPRLFVDSQD